MNNSVKNMNIYATQNNQINNNIKNIQNNQKNIIKNNKINNPINKIISANKQEIEKQVKIVRVTDLLN